MKTLKVVLIAGVLLGASHSFANVAECAGRTSMPKDAAILQKRAAQLSGNDETREQTPKRSKKIVNHKKVNG